jgi:hypothetical protein
VWEGPDSTRAPATDRVELGARFGDLRQRRVGVRRDLADPVVKSLCEVLILWAGRRVLHTSNYTKQTFVRDPVYR